MYVCMLYYAYVLEFYTYVRFINIFNSSEFSESRLRGRAHDCGECGKCRKRPSFLAAGHERLPGIRQDGLVRLLAALRACHRTL